MAGDHEKKQRPFSSSEIIFRPILVAMKMLGIYFDPVQGKNKVSESNSELAANQKKINWTYTWVGSRVYCYLVLLILWFNFVRACIGLFPLDQGIAFRVIMILWYFQCAANGSIIVVSCHRTNHFRSFYKHLNEIFHNGVAEGISCAYKCTFKFTLIVMIIGTSFLIFNTTIIDVFLFYHFSPTMKEIASYMVRPLENARWSKIMIATFMLFENGAWMLPVMFMMVVSHILKAQFHQFKECLSGHVARADGFLPSRLHELRSHYLQLCQAVEIINGTFKWILGISFLLAIFMACFISYQILSNLQEAVIVASFVFWLVACVVYVVVLANSSSDLNEAAHGLLGVLLTAGTKDATSEQVGQLNLFLTKLTATHVGFTVVDFFVIRKEFLLTLAGLYATYFFLILQFNIT